MFPYIHSFGGWADTCACGHMCVYTGVYIHVSMWRPKVEVECLPQSLGQSCTEPKAH